MREKKQRTARSADYAGVPLSRSWKIGIFFMVCCLLVAGGIRYIPEAVTVSSTTGGKELPIYSVETEKKQAALTFDAAWGDEDLDEILGILEEHEVRATFFVTGDWVERYPEAVEKIAGHGHDLGNHGENHKNMSQLTREECGAEIAGVHGRVEELLDIRMDLFRPPYGDYNNEVILAAEAAGYYSIQWDVDSLDWKDYGAESIVRTVTEHKNLGNGSIILLHNGAKYTKDALDGVVTGLQEQGYELVPVSELILRKDYSIDPAGRQLPN